MTEVFARVEKAGVEATGGDGEVVDILIVDGDQRQIEIMSNALRESGMTNEVISVNNGQEALKLLFESPKRPGTTRFGLVLLESDLPDMNGSEVLKRIRSDDRTRSIPVVFLETIRLSGEILEPGIKGNIDRPVHFSEFHALIPKIGLRWQLLKKGEGR
jgi:two-component system response regulator